MSPEDASRAAHQQRRQRSVDVLAEVSLRQAIFASTGRHLFTDMDPVVWLTGFKPMGEAQVTELLAKTADSAKDGKFEGYKTTDNFDGTAHNPQWLG